MRRLFFPGAAVCLLALSARAGLDMSALTLEKWEKDVKPQVLKFFEDGVYGRLPPKPAKLEFELAEYGYAFNGLARRRQYVIHAADAKGKLDFNVLVYLPMEKDLPKSRKGAGGIPVFIYPNFCGNWTLTDDPKVFEYTGYNYPDKRDKKRGSRPDRVALQDILRRGYGFATFCFNEVYPDDYARDVTAESVWGIFDPATLPEEKLAHPAWSWGSMRVRDLLERIPEIDQGKVAIVGQSRMGKNAVNTGVNDPRFALTCANCGGTKSLRHLPNLMYPYWFSKHLSKYVQTDQTGLTIEELERRAAPFPPLPFDQSAYIACIAPRAVVISTAKGDTVSRPEGSRALFEETEPVFKLYGKSLGWHIKEGKHSITHEDWRAFMDYADSTLGWLKSTEDMDAKPASVPLIASAPVLQNAAETSIGVSFAVSADASGWVEYSTSPDLREATKVFSGEHGLMTVDDKVALIRVTGLKPATKYYYRIGADRIEFKGGYAMKNLGSEADTKTHSFTTLGALATGSFCVINDTHGQKDAIKAVLGKIAEAKPSVVIWNGDASNTSERLEDAVEIFIRTHEDFPEYAADTPYMFLNGNHDFRGRFNRRLGELMMFRELGERKVEYAELGRNFVQRLGDVVLIGLDTGEDKLDTNPRFAGIFKMKPYREKQARWLAEMVETEAVKTAKYKVVLCHIPLFDPRPEANPGDAEPADKAPQYLSGYAWWQRTCANLWGPSLKDAGVQLVIAAHQHKYRYDAPTADRPWAQIVGGGPELGVSHKWSRDTGLTKTPNPQKFPTVIEGAVEGNRLVVTVHDVFNGRIVGKFDFAAF